MSRFLTVVLLLLLAGERLESAWAQSPIEFFLEEARRKNRPQPLHMLEPRKPVAKAAHLALVNHPQENLAQATFFVAILGDNLSIQLQQGLSEAFVERPQIAFLRRGHESSGLVREDFFDWQKASNELLASNQPLNLAIMMIGSNDLQKLRDGVDYVEPLSPRWQEIYGGRIEAISKNFADHHIKLIWVGLPPVHSEKTDGDFVKLSVLIREHGSKMGAGYVDIRDAFLNESGKYDSFGPDVKGETVKLRLGDGLHFTKPGARKLANFLESDVRHGFDAAQPDPNQALDKVLNTAPVALTSPPQAPMLPGAGQAPLPLPSQQSLPGAANPIPDPQRPAFGPIMRLGPPAFPQTHDLAQPKPNAASAATTTTSINWAEETFRNGRTPAPLPGRADDFNWPVVINTTTP